MPSAAEKFSETLSPEAKQPSGRTIHLRRALLACVLLLAIYQFSETTADPDLWGHVTFGQDMLRHHTLERSEVYSWTAHGNIFVNHEYGADLILGFVHRLLGGSGILFLKVMVGLLSFGIALRLGLKGLRWPASAVGWIFGAVAVVEISFGFAARPQIFTALCLALLLTLLRLIHAGSRWWALALPPLFVFWINTHGGALAGVGLLFLASGASTVEWIWARVRKLNSKVSAGTVLVLWIASLSVVASLFCNPWGAEMLRWLIKSVLWFRPEIEEWNPTPLGWDHANFFILTGATVFAWLASRRRRSLWEMAACGAFVILALRSVRNTPLCGIVLLALVPPHLADALDRFHSHFTRLREMWQNRATQLVAGTGLWLFALASGIATFTLHKDHPFTMEAPRSIYPVAAVDFMRAHQLGGKLLVFFDWGDLTIFHLPDCQPSIDGRLDACYSRELIAAHWKLYNGEAVDPAALPIDQADLALLPSKLAGGFALRDRPGWVAVYFDATAVILARDAKRFPGLQNVHLPVEGPATASRGRAPFPNQNPRWPKG